MISVCLVHFRGLTLDHLDAAWYSLSKQDLTGVEGVYVFDNNSDHSVDAINGVLSRYPLDTRTAAVAEGDVFVHVASAKHDDPSKTHSWSVNRVTAWANGPWIFFTRSDYILSFDCLARLRAVALAPPKVHRFVSGWCWQMAYDREARNIDAIIDIEQYGWRERGMAALLQHPFGFRFHETDEDAGVWLAEKAPMAAVGGMNEQLVSWGYQQSTFQRALKRYGVEMVAVPDYLFAHQHHYVDRDFARAKREWQQHSGI